MVKNTQKGQALTEFGLTLPITILIVLLLLDPAIALFNHAVGIYTVFKASRSASLFIADGTDTCRLEAEEDAFGAFSAPPLIMVKPGAWNLDINPCPNDPSWSPASGSDLTATLTWDQDRIFAFNFHNSSVTLNDEFQK